jgi:hypothetical protein
VLVLTPVGPGVRSVALVLYNPYFTACIRGFV